MKKYVLLLVASLSIIFGISPVYANTKTTNNITPYSTAYGDGGVSKVMIHDNRTRVWWYALPYLKSSYRFSGIVHVTFTNGKTFTRTVSKDGKAGQSVSGSVYVSGKIRRVEFWGTAYGAGGLAIGIPVSKSNDYSGGSGGMSVPIHEALYEE